MIRLVLVAMVSTSTVYGESVCLRYREAAVNFEAAAMNCEAEKGGVMAERDIVVKDLEARLKDCEERPLVTPVASDEPWFGWPLVAVALISGFALGVVLGSR